MAKWGFTEPLTADFQEDEMTEPTANQTEMEKAVIGARENAILKLIKKFPGIWSEREHDIAIAAYQLGLAAAKSEGSACRYERITNTNTPFPRVLYNSECGYQLCIIEGYKRGSAGELLPDLNLPSGACRKCSKTIRVESEGSAPDESGLLPCPFCGAEAEDKNKRLTEEQNGLMAGLKELEKYVIQTRESLGLRDCVECGVSEFEISPVDSSVGFCWNCHKLLTVALAASTEESK